MSFRKWYFLMFTSTHCKFITYNDFMCWDKKKKLKIKIKIIVYIQWVYIKTAVILSLCKYIKIIEN